MICKAWIVVLVATMIVTVNARAEIVVDNFDDASLDPVWQIVTQNGLTSWDESGGTLNVGGASGQEGELVLRYNRVFEDVGEVRIDYDWTFCEDHKARVGLGLFDSAFFSIHDTARYGLSLKGIKYQIGAPKHAIDANFVDGSYYIAYSVPTSGAFRIERDDIDFRVSYLDGAVWQTLFEGQHDFGGTDLYPYLFTSNSNLNPSWQVALDNFQADVAPVPEPTSLVLWAGLGVMGLIAARRRRRIA